MREKKLKKDSGGRQVLDGAERWQLNYEVQSPSGANSFPKHSYWLDLWLFDLVLFFFVYFLP
uniref:Uncharacterized protein n=1 Tax=Sus scrofa TaxID=9823 RepID=A0A8D0NZV8_PIG